MRGALTQLHVVHALLLRETKTRFGVNRLGYLWALIEPALMVGMFAAFYGTYGHMVEPGINIVAFITAGIVPFSLFRDTAGKCMSGIAANTGLLFYPQVRPLDLVIARAMLEFVTAVVVLVLFMGGVMLWTGETNIESWLETLGGLTLAAGLGASFGLICCGLSVYSSNVEHVMPSVLRPLIWFSAVFHPAESVPKGYRDILLYNPLVHAIEMMRDGWFPSYHAHYINPWYPMMWILIMLFLGLTLERITRRRLEVG
ncbi:MAG TPA: ABC transporter permease [Polyangiaceae bacterium]|nr:ABC transporter permease [Polyangiaceae bacterium]